jgi:hypothetical protein
VFTDLAAILTEIIKQRHASPPIIYRYFFNSGLHTALK